MMLWSLWRSVAPPLQNQTLHVVNGAWTVTELVLPVIRCVCVCVCEREREKGVAVAPLKTSLEELIW